MKTLREARRDFERAYLQAALAETNGNRTRAAELLGMNRTYFYHAMRRLQLGTTRGARNRGNAQWQNLSARAS